MAIKWYKTERGIAEEISDVPEGATVEEIDGMDVIDICIYCEDFIFEDQPFLLDSDGEYMHRKCYEEDLGNESSD